MLKDVFPEYLDIKRGFKQTLNSIRSHRILFLCFGLSFTFNSFHTINPFPTYEKRTVLSSAHGEIYRNGITAKAVKIRKDHQIFIEVYDTSLEHYQPLMTSLRVPLKHNAHYNFNSNAYDLFIVDVNKDGFKDIVSPGLDKNLHGTLLVYFYQKDTRQFQLQ